MLEVEGVFNIVSTKSRRAEPSVTHASTFLLYRHDQFCLFFILVTLRLFYRYFKLWMSARVGTTLSRILVSELVIMHLLEPLTT